MGTVLAEENLLKNVEKLSQHKGVSVGLIIGQVKPQNEVFPWGDMLVAIS